jgi:hypothetical protein
MCLGSDMERTYREGECRTTEEVRLLFERYRAEARHFAEIADEDPSPEREAERPEPVLSPSR